MQRRLGLDVEVSDEFGWMMGGYTVAEASFLAHICKAKKDRTRELVLAYAVTVRSDDRAGLEYIRDTLGVGRIYDRAARPKGAIASKPTSRYDIRRIGDLYHIIVPLFEKYPLPQAWRKAREFDVWKQLVDIKYHRGGRIGLGRAAGGKSLGHAPLPQLYWDKMEPLVEELKRLRIYN